MPIAKVHRISAGAPDDVSGIEAAIADGRIDPQGVIAVLAKTEGNGLVNDFSRGFATLTLQLLFERYLPKADAAAICFVMSGGTEGGMAPHWIVFERAAGDAGAATGARHRPRPHAGTAGRASRPPAAGRPGGRWRARRDARCGHHGSGRRAFRAAQVPAA